MLTEKLLNTWKEGQISRREEFEITQKNYQFYEVNNALNFIFFVEVNIKNETMCRNSEKHVPRFKDAAQFLQ